jgi:hypothetical protein
MPNENSSSQDFGLAFDLFTQTLSYFDRVNIRRRNQTDHMIAIHFRKGIFSARRGFRRNLSPTGATSPRTKLGQPAGSKPILPTSRPLAFLQRPNASRENTSGP